jgi:lipopolysaccharide transport system permease protein
MSRALNILFSSQKKEHRLLQTMPNRGKWRNSVRICRERVNQEATQSRSGPSIQRRILIEAGGLERNYWRDLWSYHELFFMLAWRDVAVRYKQTLIGIAWAAIRPALTILIFTVIFGRLANLPSEGTAPYPVMVFAGMLPWFLFSTILSEASSSLVGNANLIGKVFFPRIIIPASTAIVALVDFAINMLLLFIMMLLWGFLPSWQIAFLPIFVVLAIIASMGPALYLTALNVKYRDFRYIVPFVLQFGLYVSPVGFSSVAIPDHWRFLYSLNPLVGVIDGFRWCLLGGQSDLYVSGLLISITVAMIFFWAGIKYFRRTESKFADIV